MRIRTIKPEFFLHEGLFDLERETSLPIRLAFIGIWCAADREGRFRWEPRKLGVQILPWDNVDFSRVLDALVTRGFVCHYASESGDFGCIPSFLRHQVINNRERPSELPNPLDCNEIDACPTRAPRVATRGQSCKGEGKGREWKGKERKGMEEEGNGKEESLSASGPAPSSQIQEIFQSWDQVMSSKRRTAMTQKRIQAAKARIKEADFLSSWQESLGMIPSIPFLMGQNDRGWRADIDWFLRPDSVIKIIEGKYSTAKPRPLHKGIQEPDLITKGF